MNGIAKEVLSVARDMMAKRLSYREFRNGNIGLEYTRGNTVAVVDTSTAPKWNVTWMDFDNSDISRSQIKVFINVEFGKDVTFFGR
jgi:hypothetical protein